VQGTTTQTAKVIDLGYQPRSAFQAFHARRQRWACLVIHRRAGKTVACVMDLLDAALRCDKPDGRFAYIAPTFTQAKDVAWLYLKRFSAPLEGVEQRESDLSIILANGARIRLYGAETYDRMRGLYFDGVVLDEVADMDPRAWSEVIRPALADRRGWAAFIGTSKGRNEFWNTWNRAQGDPEWFSLMLKASESGILPPDEIADMRKTMSEDEYQQEMECSFDAAVKGAYYGRLLDEAQKDGRICSVPYDPAAKVDTWWDLGVGDSTAIWFTQVVGREIHVIDHHEMTGEGLPYYAKVLAEKPYVYGRHMVPHDAAARELGTGKSRVETARALGMTFNVQPRMDVDDGINAVRQTIPRCWFDAKRCAAGLEALRMYRKDFDEKMKTFRDKPRHDWTSHSADAFRTGCAGRTVSYEARPERAPRYVSPMAWAG
jgi:phage terminase large subunit